MGQEFHGCVAHGLLVLPGLQLQDAVNGLKVWRPAAHGLLVPPLCCHSALSQRTTHGFEDMIREPQVTWCSAPEPDMAPAMASRMYHIGQKHCDTRLTACLCCLTSVEFP